MSKESMLQKWKKDNMARKGWKTYGMRGRKWKACKKLGDEVAIEEEVRIVTKNMQKKERIEGLEEIYRNNELSVRR